MSLKYKPPSLQMTAQQGVLAKAMQDVFWNAELAIVIWLEP